MMKSALAILVLAGLSACGAGISSLTGDAAPPPADAAVTAEQAEAIALAIGSVEVVVPRSLVVSEEDLLIPNADIVWRGDPPGDRHQQVAEIFLAAAKVVSGEAPPEGAAPAEAEDDAANAAADTPGLILSIEVTRFHALTERARYTTGGNYGMRYTLTLRDPASGAVVSGPHKIVGDIKAVGGARALAEEMAGRTEKAVVTARIVQVLQVRLAELIVPAEG